MSKEKIPPQPAFPTESHRLYTGLTKREYIATRVLCIILADPGKTNMESIIDDSIRITDRLLEALGK